MDPGLRSPTTAARPGAASTRRTSTATTTRWRSSRATPTTSSTAATAASTRAVRPRQDLALLREPARSPSSTRSRSTTPCPSTTSTAARRTTAASAGRRRPSTPTASPTSTGSITFGADGYTLRHRSDRPEHDLRRVAGGQPAALRPEEPRDASTSARGPEPGDPPLRFNWDSPILVSPHSHTRLYYAGQFVWRSDDRGDSWTRSAPTSRATSSGSSSRSWAGVERGRAVGPRRPCRCSPRSRSLSESPPRTRADLRRDRRRAHPGDGGRRQDLAEGRQAARRPRALLRQRHQGRPGSTRHGLRGRRQPQDRRLQALPAEERRPRPDLDHRSPATCHSATLVWARRPGPRQEGPALRRHRVRHLRHARRRQALDEARRRRARPSRSATSKIQERESDLVGASFGRGFFVLDDYSPLRQIDEESWPEERAALPRQEGAPVHPADADRVERQGHASARRTISRPTRRSAPSSPIT